MFLLDITLFSRDLIIGNLARSLPCVLLIERERLCMTLSHLVILEPRLGAPTQK
jgi:hypothetical protein